MFEVKILKPDGVEWVDHLGNNISELVFSKKYHKNYVPGYYPLESAGSLYRNIDNFRESPLQSRTDWEIRIPSVFTLDGVKMVDLLYWLEEMNGGNFELIGCEARLYKDDEPEPIYIGVVESVVSGNSLTSSIRISDWLGNPQSGSRKFPVAIGVPGPNFWEVKMKRGIGKVHLEIMENGIDFLPSLYLKFAEEYYRLERYSLSNAGEPSTFIWSDGNNILDIFLKGRVVYTLPAAISEYTSIILPKTALTNFRPEKRDTPNYYIMGEGEQIEIVEAWSNRLWLKQQQFDDTYPSGLEGYPIGRGVKRYSHPEGTQLREIPDNLDLMLNFKIDVGAESIVMDDSYPTDYPPFQVGSPSQLVLNSSVEREPRFTVPKNDNFDVRISLLHPAIWTSEGGCNFTINLALPQGVPENAILTPDGHYIDIALDYSPSNNHNLTYTAKLVIGGFLNYNLSSLMNGKIIRINLNNFAVALLSSMLKLKFEFKLNLDGNPSLSDAKEVGHIRVLYARASFSVSIPLGNNKLYVSRDSITPGSLWWENVEGKGIKPIISELLKESGIIEQIPIAGNPNGYLYGSVLKGEVWAVRDKLRSLAAESVTMVKFNPQKKEILVEKISLQEEIPYYLIEINSLLSEGGIYSFKMESADRNDIISELSIHWGKDFDSGKYAHILNVSRDIYADNESKDRSEFKIPADKWMAVFARMKKNAENGDGINKTIESEWITSWEAAENMAYNLLYWNTAPMRKAQARCILPVLDALKNSKNENKKIDIGSFTCFDLPGYPKEFRNKFWIVTGRHDDLDTLVVTLELLEARDLPAVPPNRYLLLEDERNLLFEDEKKIKLEDFYE